MNSTTKIISRFPSLPSISSKKPLSSTDYIPNFSSLRFCEIPKMALKAVHVSDVPNLDHVPSEIVSSPRLSKGTGKFTVIGHRGSGMNRLNLADPRMKDIKENSILSFNTAASFNLDFIEFDVQVTKDGCPIIFHDNFIFTEENGNIIEKDVTELTLAEFSSYGPQKEEGKIGKPLLRRTKDGKMIRWDVKTDDTLCTLQETFEKVNPKLGFNIELKLNDDLDYEHGFLVTLLQSILKVVFKYANERQVIFSSFQPDAALLMGKIQGTYPVYFLTNGGTQLYNDVRRNSIEEAIKVCLDGGLHGIVSEAKAVFRNPGAVSMVKDARLSLLTYGTLNNVAESVYLQHLMGVDGVIVDFVQEITEAVNKLIKEGNGQLQLESKPQFTQTELSFLLKLIPELIQQ